MCRYTLNYAATPARAASVTLNFFQGLSCSTPGARLDKWTLKHVQGDGVVE